jgi:hypothetical protein
MSDLVDHLETYLGPIVSGYSKDDEGKKLPFQIARFENARPRTVTLVTLGFSDIHLALGRDGRRVRQEYLLTVNPKWDAPNLPALLHQVAMEAYEKNSAYLRGQVLGPRGTLVAGTALEALYVAMPVYFPDAFHVYERVGAEPIVLVWLVPITASEAHFAKERGYDAFEDLLVERDPDLRDLGREAIA